MITETVSLPVLGQKTHWMMEKFCRPCHFCKCRFKNKIYFNFANTIHNFTNTIHSLYVEFVQHTFARLRSPSWTNSQRLKILFWVLVIIVIIKNCGWNVTNTAKSVIRLSPFVELVNDYCPMQLMHNTSAFTRSFLWTLSTLVELLITLFTINLLHVELPLTPQPHVINAINP